MSGNVQQFVDFSSNTANDTGENTTTSIQPILNGNPVDATNLGRPDESLRQRTEAIRNVEVDSLYLRDSDRTLVITGPGKVTWPGSTTAAHTGIPVLSDTLYLLPMLSPGFAQAAPVPPVASAFGVIHLKRVTGSLNSILVTSQRRSYAAGDQISIDVTSGVSFACTLDSVTGYQRTVHIVAQVGVTQLSTVISALNALTPSAPDNTALVTAALENGALGTDLLLTPQAKQFVTGNYDGEGHAVTPANLAAFFTGNPTSALAEGDTLGVWFPMVSDTASTGGRRQATPENANTAVPVGSFFNSRLNPEKIVNAIPICKVVNGNLVFATGAEVPIGATTVSIGEGYAASVQYAGGGNWADGTTNPATTVEAQLDKVISDLAGAAGTAKIQGATVSSYLVAATLATQLTRIELLLRNPLPLTETDFTPLRAFRDWNNNVSSLVDHNGFPMGEFSALDEHWHGTTAPVGWTEGHVNVAVAYSDPSTTLNQRSVFLQVADVGFSDALSVTSTYETYINTTARYVLEFPVIGGAGFTAAFATTLLGVIDGSSNPFVYFKYIHATSVNWLFISNGVTVDTGIPVADSTVYNMRIEIFGSAVNSSGLTKARGFINGALVATVNNSTGGSTKIAVLLSTVATAVATSPLNIGRVRRCWAHKNVEDAL